MPSQRTDYFNTLSEHLRWLVVQATRTNAQGVRYGIHSGLKFAIADAMAWLNAHAGAGDDMDWYELEEGWHSVTQQLDNERNRVLQLIDEQCSVFLNDPQYLFYKLKRAEAAIAKLNGLFID